MFKALSLTAIALLLLAGFAGSIGASMVLDSTNTTEFCTSCHSMQWNQAEWEDSLHFQNAAGVRAGCADCHVPQALGPALGAKLIAARDVWGEITGIIDSKDKFEAHRWHMANRVWERMAANDSRECRSCHSFAAMDFTEQDRSAKRKHHRASETGDKTCIDCHKGVAHKLPRRPKTAEKQASQEVL